jgi:hypothetical protein
MATEARRGKAERGFAQGQALGDDPLARGYDSEAERYRPENRIVLQPWTLRQRRLLLIEERRLE